MDISPVGGIPASEEMQRKTKERFDIVGVALQCVPQGSTEVTINGVPIRALRSIKIDASYDRATEVTITMLANVEGSIESPIVTTTEE